MFSPAHLLHPRSLAAKAVDHYVLGRWRLVRNLLRVVRQRAAAGALPTWRQLVEILCLRLARGQTARYYLIARFWRREMPWRDKLDHLNYHEYKRVRDALNAPAYRPALNNKLVQKMVLIAMEIPTPRLLGYFHPELGRSRDGHTLRDAADLHRLLTDWRGDRIALKDCEGFGGQNFMSLSVRRSSVGVLLEVPLSGQTWTLVQLESHLAKLPHGYVLEEHLEQHPVLQRIHRSSVNTLRIWVRRDRRGARVIGGFLRVGRGAAMIDNTAAGGLVCTIDPQSGALVELSEGHVTRAVYAAHPDSGVPVAGIRVPYWNEAQELACVALDCFPHMHLGGLDIAITEQGPSVIEVNLDNPGQVMMAYLDLPGKRVFRDLFEALPRGVWGTTRQVGSLARTPHGRTS